MKSCPLLGSPVDSVCYESGVDNYNDNVYWECTISYSICLAVHVDFLNYFSNQRMRWVYSSSHFKDEKWRLRDLGKSR